MLKKFSDGLMFGAGFTISFVIVWFLAAFLISPMFFSSKIEQMTRSEMSKSDFSKLPNDLKGAATTSELDAGFNDMSLDDQIKNSTVIAIAKYETGSDGKMEAIITEFLKKDADVEIFYKLGDEYKTASYYPKDNTLYGDGVVIFFTGSPASMRMSMSYEGDRIRGLGDLPIELLKKKCRSPNA